MSSRTSVQAVLNRVRPYLQADGGDLELVDIQGPEVFVRLTGACASCPQAQMTLHFGIESALRHQMPDIRIVRLA
jgi:Fe-S cluster biogenesis protein NfuA